MDVAAAVAVVDVGAVKFGTVSVADGLNELAEVGD